ncbi:MAG: hypothetical protein HY275_12915 [Gemmatimonadetes bacterium]|nr:hypothetical protein [Gemmatimonadota bacterium]
MFVQLLLVTFAVALATASLVAWAFAKPMGSILARLVAAELAPAWRRYLVFAVYVTGVSGGVRLWELERYVTPDKDGRLLVLTSERWTVELIKTVLGALQGTAWMLLVFFLFALVAYVVVRGFEGKRGQPAA